MKYTIDYVTLRMYEDGRVAASTVIRDDMGQEIEGIGANLSDALFDLADLLEQEAAIADSQEAGTAC